MSEIFAKSRLRIFSAIATLSVFVVILSYAKIIIAPNSKNTSITSNVERGTIFDRSGKILAVQNTVYNVSATPSAITDLPKTAEELSLAMGIPASKIEEQIRSCKGNFLYLKKKVSQSEHDDIRSAIERHKIRGIRLEKTTSRVYPENNLASQVVGFMGDGSKGLSGVEYSLQHILMSGENSFDGEANNVVLTIDANLQYKLEQIAQEAMNETRAESVMLLAADANTGEILSYISLPSANLNTYPSSKESERVDRPAMFAYEPGSVFKLFSVASFIDSGGISPNDQFLCDGVYDIRSSNGEQVRITCLEHHGWLTPRQALEYSCNDVLAQMSECLTSEGFLQRIRSFGFGEKTGIELPGETRGSVKTTEDKFWSARSKPTMSIGQELSVSALQMLEAMTAIANDGKPLQLSLISKIVSKDGREKYVHTPREKPAILKESTAQYILNCMAGTAQVGTGHRAALQDVSVGVKTGTAQMLDSKRGGYSTEDFLSNCMAVFPVENPQVILYIAITKARGETYAGRIVAPVIQKAADIITDHIGLNRENSVRVTHSGVISIPQITAVKVGSILPDFEGLSKKELAHLIEIPNLNVVINGEGWVYAQNPPPGTPITEGMKIELYLE